MPTQDAITTFLASGAGVVAFPLMWMAVCWLLGLLSGWQSAARRYRSRFPPNDWTWVGYARVGWVQYKNVLRLGVTETHLHLKVMFLFRVGHPPLEVPWEDVTQEETRSLLGTRRVRLRLGPSGTTVTLPPSAAARLPITD